MCANCFTSADTLLLRSAGAVTMLRQAPPWVRRSRYVADAEFVRTLGMDPVEVLGAPPGDDHAEGREPVLVDA
jgi:hypothetical protein